MTTVAVDAPLNMHTLNTWYGSLVVANASEIEISNGSLAGIYYGNFTYDASGNVQGTWTSYKEFFSGYVALTINGLNFSASTCRTAY